MGTETNSSNQVQDQDKKFLQESQAFTIEAAGYRLVKSYNLNVQPNCSAAELINEIKTLKDEGFEVEAGFTDKGVALRVIKVVDLTDLEELAKHIGDQ